MLDIVINTNYNSAGTKVCIDELLPRLTAAGHHVVRNDWQHYERYQLALFASPDAQVQRAKQRNPKLAAGIVVPMTDYTHLQANARAADFLIVGSLEARDEQLRYNTNIFIYHHFPETYARFKKHQASSPTIIGYHGNKEHLVNFYPSLTRALERIAQKHPIELWAIYNYQRHGRWRRHVPQGVPVRHIQWLPTVYDESLSQCDIGIVNTTIPAGRGWRHVITQPISHYLKSEIQTYHAHDTVIRFKYPTNAGRVYPFAQLGIPVVADFAPSLSQIITDGVSGFIVNSEQGWYWALDRLISSPQLRQTMSDALRVRIDTTISPDRNFVRLSKFFLDQVRRTHG